MENADISCFQKFAMFFYLPMIKGQMQPLWMALLSGHLNDQFPLGSKYITENWELCVKLQELSFLGKVPMGKLVL